ncbi:conserved phage C-terminal domain-containing protein [Weissella viridescens]|uniref:conserved phage C-terminal domain-containing protein n=1 Tax=Weissella viridescens TaxID=1629 RepID=UPI004056C640
MAKITKYKKSNFTTLSNTVIEDVRLSWKARGIFQYLYSKSDDWQFYTSEVVKHSTKDKMAALRTGLDELETYGYLKRVQKKTDAGKFDTYDWVISDEPMLDEPDNDFPYADKPEAEKPQADNRTLPNTDEPNTDKPNTNSKKTSMSSSDEHDPTLVDVTRHLITKINELSGSKYRVTDKTKSMVKARLKDYTAEELNQMLEYVWNDWANWRERSKYFRPQTLFAPSKTDEYIAKMQASPKQREADPDDWLAQVTEAADKA